MADHTHADYPIVGTSPSRIVQTELATPVDASGSTLGQGMVPQPGYPRIEGAVVTYKGRGRFDLDEPNVPPGDVRFTRGPRLNGRAGTLDLWFTMPASGSARTLCYLTDDVDSPTNFLALGFDASNQPTATITDSGGTDVAVFAGSAAIAEGRTVHLRFTWDAVNLVNGVRHANIVVNEEVPAGSWSTDPTSGWNHFKPTHLVLTGGIDGANDITDASVIKLAQGSNRVLL